MRLLQNFSFYNNNLRLEPVARLTEFCSRLPVPKNFFNLTYNNIIFLCTNCYMRNIFFCRACKYRFGTCAAWAKLWYNSVSGNNGGLISPWAIMRTKIFYKGMDVKKIGLIGGIGPASTLDYYMGIINGYRQKMSKPNYPEIIIYSIDMFEMLFYIENEQWDKAAMQLSEAVNNLSAAGAHFAAIASNTPHLIFDEIRRQSNIPLISIVEETCKFVTEKHYQRVLTIGTLFTMKNGLYSNSLTSQGIVSLLPTETEQRQIYSLFFPNLENGIVIQEDKIKMLELVNRIIKEQNADSVILGCTELPMMIKQGDLHVPVINTTQVHINSIVRSME